MLSLLSSPPFPVQQLQLSWYKSFRRQTPGRGERPHKTQGYWPSKKKLELETGRNSRSPSSFQDGALTTAGLGKAAACNTHRPGSSRQACAFSGLRFRLLPSLQLWWTGYRVFKHLLTYWTDVTSRPFPKHRTSFLLNTHFMIKVGADGYVSTASSSFLTPTPLSRTSS